MIIAFVIFFSSFFVEKGYPFLTDDIDLNEERGSTRENPEAAQSRTSSEVFSNFCQGNNPAEDFIPYELFKKISDKTNNELNHQIRIDRDDDGNKSLHITMPSYIKTCLKDSFTFHSRQLPQSNHVIIGLKYNRDENSSEKSGLEYYKQCLMDNGMINTDGSFTDKAKRNVSFSPPTSMKIPLPHDNPKEPMKIAWANPWNTDVVFDDNEKSLSFFGTPERGWDTSIINDHKAPSCFKYSTIDGGDVRSRADVLFKKLKQACSNSDYQQFSSLYSNLNEIYILKKETTTVLDNLLDTVRSNNVDEILDQLKETYDNNLECLTESNNNPQPNDPQECVSEFAREYGSLIKKYDDLTSPLINELNIKMEQYENAGSEREEQLLITRIEAIKEVLKKIKEKSGSIGHTQSLKILKNNDYGQIAIRLRQIMLESAHFSHVCPRGAECGRRKSFASAKRRVDSQMERYGKEMEEAQKEFEVRTGRATYSKEEFERAARISDNNQTMLDRFNQNYRRQYTKYCTATFGGQRNPNKCQNIQRRMMSKSRLLNPYIQRNYARSNYHRERAMRYEHLEMAAQAYYDQLNGDDYYGQYPDIYSPYPSHGRPYPGNFGSPGGHGQFYPQQQPHNNFYPMGVPPY